MQRKEVNKLLPFANHERLLHSKYAINISIVPCFSQPRYFHLREKRAFRFLFPARDKLLAAMRSWQTHASLETIDVSDEFVRVCTEKYNYAINSDKGNRTTASTIVVATVKVFMYTGRERFATSKFVGNSRSRNVQPVLRIMPLNCTGRATVYVLPLNPT